MAQTYRILILEDEPLILMDLEYAALDRDCTVHCASSCSEALDLLAADAAIDIAVLDVSLGKDSTCLPVAQALTERGIPYLLHSGDLDRHDETIRTLEAQLIAKPAPADKVIAAAIVCAEGQDPTAIRIAAE